MEEEIEIPEYFICPISLEIMRDPVTTITGITYDRQSIEKWISDSIKSKNKNKNKVVCCPVTKLPLPETSDLTPNHTLRRLIQSWCAENAARGVDKMPTPRAPLERSNVVEMIKNLRELDTKLEMVKKIEALAMESDRNRRLMAEAGVHRSMISFIVKRFNEGRIEGLEESLRVLRLIGVPSGDARRILIEDNQILESITWVLRIESGIKIMIRSYTIELLRTLTEHTSSHVIERLNPEVFRGIIGFIRDVNRINSNPRRHVSSKEHNLAIKQAVNAALMILLETSSWSRNRTSIVESGAVFEILELELNSPMTTSEKRTTELVLGVLSRLCSCAEGRAQFLAHQGGVAAVTKRVLRVSPAADDRALAILNLVSKFSPANTVVQEMVSVGAVSKLCTVLQVDCAANLKEKAKEILRAHYDEFKKFSCVDKALLTKLVNL